MINIVEKSNFYKTNYIWFADDVNDININVDINRLIIYGTKTKIERINNNKCICTKQETLITDLTKPTDELWGLLSKSLKHEINRSQRDSLIIKHFVGNEISYKILQEFNKCYHEMYCEKGIDDVFLPINELIMYANNNNLMISIALLNNIPVVYHSYVIDDEHSRSFQSCSNFRIMGKDYRRAVGRANKFLHWNDILFLKEKGILEYDWGGVHSYKTPNGIDEFKISFNGKYKEYYNITCNLTLFAKFCSLLNRLKQII